MRQRARPHAPAIAIARFQNDHAQRLAGEETRGGEAGCAGTDDDDVGINLLRILRFYTSEVKGESRQPFARHVR